MAFLLPFRSSHGSRTVRQREPRQKVLVRARMRSGADWADVLIHNMSSRGLLATAEAEHRTGTVIEIRRIHHVIVGRVVWQQGPYFGVRTQDRIDIDGVVSAKPPAHKPEGATIAPGQDRRSPRRAMPIAEREEQSRRFAARFQFMVMIVVLGGSAVAVAEGVFGLLSRPFAAIGTHLGVG